MKNILTNHNYDYIIKPIISEYTQDSLTEVFNSYPNNLHSNVLDWYKEDVCCNNFFASGRCFSSTKIWAKKSSGISSILTKFR